MTERIRVLLAEDQDDLRLALAEVIATDPALEVVALAADAVEAVRMAAETRPDIALVDVKMPGGGGPAAVRGILGGPAPARVIALSAYDDRDSVLRMLRAGAMGYLVKGTSMEEILRAVHSTMLGQGVLSAEVMAGVIHELSGKLREEEAASRLRTRRQAEVRQVLLTGGPRMVFQPIADLRTGTIVGLEALARFDRPPPRSPEAWFTQAGASGLREDLELAALRHALDHLSRIPAPLYLSVNLSPLTVTSAPFREALESLPADRLVLELTEHAHVENYGDLLEVLADVRTAGGRVAVDDAGAGFASLRHVLRIAPEFIKLDISLTRGLDVEPAHRAMGAALIAFASEMGSTIVAEGIETLGELEALRALGVTHGQGFLLAAPEPLAELPAGLVVPFADVP